MSSHGSYSSSNIKDDYGQGGHRPQYSGAFNESQPAQDGMTTQPSVGRFTEKERANSMFVRKPATPALAPASQSGMSGSGSNNSSGIVNLRGAPLPEGKVSGTEVLFSTSCVNTRVWASCSACVFFCTSLLTRGLICTDEEEYYKGEELIRICPSAQSIGSDQHHVVDFQHISCLVAGALGFVPARGRNMIHCVAWYVEVPKRLIKLNNLHDALN